MKIGVMSDTHDRLETVELAIKVFQKQKVKLIIHCGDWVSPFVPQYIYNLKPKLTIPIKSVFGNNEGDIFRFLKRQKSEKWNIDFSRDIFDLLIEDKKIAVYHGHNSIITDSLMKSGCYNAIFTGHTHEALNKFYDKTLHLNPGTTSGYCNGKNYQDKTVAIYNVINNTAKIINLK